MAEVTCTSCEAPNRAAARFCADCGASLLAVCPTCSTEPRAGARFCDACGTPLRPTGDPAPPRTGGESRQVTVLFADVANSIELAEQLDAADWAEVVSRLRRVCTDAVERFGGTVESCAGDGVVATFGAPVAQEDHARRAAHAALLLSGAAGGIAPQVHAAHGVDLAVRVGLNSGEVVAGPVGAADAAVAHPVGLAQRMESLAQPGAVYVSEHTARLIAPWFGLRDLGRFTVKDAATPIGVFELTTGASAGPTAARKLLTARIVGRETERATLGAALDAAVDGHAQVLGVVGEDGAGKSRLCEELAREATDTGIPVRRTTGLAHATAVPLLPIRMLFRDYFGLADDDCAADSRDRIASRLLDLDHGLREDLPVVFDFLEVGEPDRHVRPLGAETRRARLLEVLRRIARARSERGPLVLVLEDLHFFDEQSRAFLEAWLPSFVGTRTLVVANFRPEFVAAWTNRPFYRQLSLQPLGREAVARMLGELLGSDPSLAVLSEALGERAGGSPLFVEEMVRGWADDGTLAGGPGAYRLARPLGQVVVPPTVQAVLASRIDRLSQRQKGVLQAASVVGRLFDTAVLDRVADLDPDDLADALHQLCAAELIAATHSGDYRFWNPLTREVAYGSLLATARRGLHRAVADALAATAPERLDELAVLVATHYEAAEDHVRAAHLRIRAGRVAMATDFALAERNVRLGLAHLERVVTTAETERLGVEGRTILLRMGSRTGMAPADSAELFDRAGAAAEHLADPHLLALLGIARGNVALWVQGRPREADEHWTAARRHCDRDDVELNAHLAAQLGWTACYRGRLCDGLEQATRAMELCAGEIGVGLALAGCDAADSAGTVAARILALSGELDGAALELARTLEELSRHTMLESHAWALTVATEIAYLTGDPATVDAARTHARTALHLAGESGNAGAVVRARYAVGLGELLAGRADVAVASLRQGLEQLRSGRAATMEEGYLLAALARAELSRGDVATAGRLAQEAMVVAERQEADVVACAARLTWAQVLVATAVADSDRALAAATIAAGFELAEATGALTYAAFLAEQEARLSGSVRSLAAAASDYESIGATGHAARLRADLARATAPTV
ncbi:MAG: ATP-binding protein [Sporichthyaceae bacterium]